MDTAQSTDVTDSKNSHLTVPNDVIANACRKLASLEGGRHYAEVENDPLELEELFQKVASEAIKADVAPEFKAALLPLFERIHQYYVDKQLPFLRYVGSLLALTTAPSSRRDWNDETVRSIEVLECCLDANATVPPDALITREDVTGSYEELKRLADIATRHFQTCKHYLPRHQTIECKDDSSFMTSRLMYVGKCQHFYRMLLAGGNDLYALNLKHLPPSDAIDIDTFLLEPRSPNLTHLSDEALFRQLNQAHQWELTEAYDAYDAELCRRLNRSEAHIFPEIFNKISCILGFYGPQVLPKLTVSCVKYLGCLGDDALPIFEPLQDVDSLSLNWNKREEDTEAGSLVELAIGIRRLFPNLTELTLRIDTLNLNELDDAVMRAFPNTLSSITCVSGKKGTETIHFMRTTAEAAEEGLTPPYVTGVRLHNSTWENVAILARLFPTISSFEEFAAPERNQCHLSRTLKIMPNLKRWVLHINPQSRWNCPPLKAICCAEPTQLQELVIEGTCKLPKIVRGNSIAGHINLLAEMMLRGPIDRGIPSLKVLDLSGHHVEGQAYAPGNLAVYREHFPNLVSSSFSPTTLQDA